MPGGVAGAGPNGLPLCRWEVGKHFPGFETDIHGAYKQDDGRYKVKVIKR
jgi:arginine/lysine/ornithine decarboxylase